MKAEYIIEYTGKTDNREHIKFAVISGSVYEKEILDLIDGYDYDFLKDGDRVFYYLYADGNGYENFTKLWERAKELLLKGGEKDED